jgi:hypothetical protein
MTEELKLMHFFIPLSIHVSPSLLNESIYPNSSSQIPQSSKELSPRLYRATRELAVGLPCRSSPSGAWSGRGGACSGCGALDVVAPHPEHPVLALVFCLRVWTSTASPPLPCFTRTEPADKGRRKVNNRPPARWLTGIQTAGWYPNLWGGKM